MAAIAVILFTMTGSDPKADLRRYLQAGREVLLWKLGDGAEPNADMWATAEEWPPEHREVTLHRILVHMVPETDRHAGHADIVRELIDGATGLRVGDDLASGDRAWWERYRGRLERVAREAGSA